jgi:hypothetical protein
LKIFEQLEFRLEGRNRIFYGEPLKNTPGFNNTISNDAGYFNLTKNWINNKTVKFVSDIDRALLNYQVGKFKMTAGRQRINWGINNIWNPNDVFNVYNFLDYDYEERPGSDALRVQYLPNASSTVELAFKPSKYSNKEVAAGLYRFNRWKYDVQFLAGIFENEFLLGAGWAGNILEAGFKGEVSYFEKDNDLIASLFFDYTFKNSWYVSSSFLYMKNPAAVALEEQMYNSNRQSVKHLMPYRYTFFTNCSKAFTPIFSASLSLIYSTQYNSTIIYPSLNYNIAENFDLDVFWQSFISESLGKYKPSLHSFSIRLRWSY